MIERDLLDAIAAAADAADRATVRRDVAIAAAVAGGLSYRAVAAEAGIALGSVTNIVRRVGALPLTEVLGSQE